VVNASKAGKNMMKRIENIDIYGRMNGQQQRKDNIQHEYTQHKEEN
jgi:hypothetical protein